MQTKSAWHGLAVDALALAFLGLLFWFLAGKLIAVRTPGNGDQASYLELAVNLRAGEGFVTERLSPFYPTREIVNPESVRQPLVPLILSTIATQDFNFFLRARWLLWSVSLLTLLAFYAGAAWIWGRVPAFLAMALLGLNVHFHTYASEIWCENLLILFSTAAALLIHRFFKSESWRPAYSLLVAAGTASALAWYTKSSAAALVIAFTAVCLLRLAGELRRRSSNLEIYSRCLAPLARYLIPFFFLLAPYMVLNLINTGTLLRNRDLRAAMWVADSANYYIPHESAPSLFGLLRDEPFYYFFYRMGIGLWLQLGNHLEALKVAPFGDTQLLSALLLLAALASLFGDRLGDWRKFVLILLGFNLLAAAWYVAIDVAPRFIFIGIPLLSIHAALGIRDALEWLMAKTGWERSALLRHTRNLVFAVPFLFLGLTFWQNREALTMRPKPLLTDEISLVYYLKDNTDPSDVLLMGPSHQLPWNYIFSRRYIFVPSFERWDHLINYIDHFKAKYFLLDTEVYHRRISLFSRYVGLTDSDGLFIKESLPRMEPLPITAKSPRRFILFRILPSGQTAAPLPSPAIPGPPLPAGR